MDNCIVKSNSNSLLKIGYISLLAISGLVTVVILTIIIKAVYRRCKAGPRPVSRISPIISEQSNLDLNYMNGT